MGPICYEWNINPIISGVSESQLIVGGGRLAPNPQKSMKEPPETPYCKKLFWNLWKLGSHAENYRVTHKEVYLFWGFLGGILG